jgi:hypothetical protein
MSEEPSMKPSNLAINRGSSSIKFVLYQAGKSLKGVQNAD